MKKYKITRFNPFRLWCNPASELETHTATPTTSLSLLQQLKSTRSWRRRWCLQWRLGCYIWLPPLCCFLWVAPKWRAREPPDGVAERRVQAHDGAPRPVEAGVDPLKNRPSKQDVYPRIQDLVPGGEAQPKQKISDVEFLSGQNSLCNKDLVVGRMKERRHKEGRNESNSCRGENTQNTKKL